MAPKGRAKRVTVKHNKVSFKQAIGVLHHHTATAMAK